MAVMTAAAPIRPLAWEFPYAIDAALKIRKEKRERKKEEKHKKTMLKRLSF